MPAGPKIASTGGLDFNSHRQICDKLDRVHAKHPDMVLLHGGSPNCAELIAAKWAGHRNGPQIAFKPDWTKHANAAPFKRNDPMLNVLPIGVTVFPGTNIRNNPADKDKKFGIPVWKFRTDDAWAPNANSYSRSICCPPAAAAKPGRPRLAGSRMAGFGQQKANAAINHVLLHRCRCVI